MTGVQTCALPILPAIAVSPPQGKLLHLLARSIGARSVLEIGTLGGYSTIWLARAVGQDGHVLTLEPFARLARADREALDAEAEAVLRYLAGTAGRARAQAVSRRASA